MKSDFVTIPKETYKHLNRMAFEMYGLVGLAIDDDIVIDADKWRKNIKMIAFKNFKKSI